MPTAISTPTETAAEAIARSNGGAGRQVCVRPRFEGVHHGSERET